MLVTVDSGLFHYKQDSGTNEVLAKDCSLVEYRSMLIDYDDSPFGYEINIILMKVIKAVNNCIHKVQDNNFL